MKFAQYGTAIVVMHLLTHGLHGLAHVEVPVALSLLQSSFVAIVILLIPILAAILLWKPFYRVVGSWLLLSSITGSLLFSIYNHFIVMSPDHVSQVSFVSWGLLFQVTAYSILIVDGLGCWIAVWALKAIQQPEKLSESSRVI